MSHLVTRVYNHSQKVCRLYKKALKEVKNYYMEDRARFRYEATLMRARFDANKDVKDMREARRLLEEGEKEWFENKHPDPFVFSRSPDGILTNRTAIPNDVVLDSWDPIEKAAYPIYFARREQRKREYLEMWNKKYGQPTSHDH